LIGRRYLEERKTEGRPKGSLFDKKLDKSCPVNGLSIDNTSQTIASQSKVHYNTVKNNAIFAEAVNTIVKTLNISRHGNRNA
jgi:hypothetical protein